MICRVCGEDKDIKDMYFEPSFISKTCNKCKHKQTQLSIERKKNRQKEFVRKFNKIIGKTL